jgi:DNA transformation protein
MELFAPFGDITNRKMFGGLGLYRDGEIFALVSSEGHIFLKAKAPRPQALDDSSQFHNMPYWSLPDHCLDDPEVACALARDTHATL